MTRRSQLCAIFAVLLACACGAIRLAGGSLDPQAEQAPRKDSLLGFTVARREPQLAYESKMTAAISAQSISEMHRVVTARPHIAGTAGGKAIADAIAERLRSFGLSVEMDAHTAYLSYPKRLQVTLHAPEQKEIAVTEPAIEPDRAAASSAELTPGFVAYSPSAKVRAPVVYVNYGLPADYDALQAAGVEVKGAIAIARYGRVHRAVKVFNAEQRGARGIIFYSDPADDGFAQGVEWPRGLWRPPQFLQRGNAKYSWYYHGDPLTNGYACGPDCLTPDPKQVPTLPKIPAVALSWSAAEPILRALLGPAAPRGFQGALPFTYHAGPGAADVELDIEMENGPRPIYNVIGKIDGVSKDAQWVILGTHHDAWTYGGVDPGSACAVLLELARVLGEMRRGGWQPERTIVFGFWDAEEYGLIGSTEFAERHAAVLREKAVVYINSDLYMTGNLRAGGTASLRDFVAEVARDAASPAGGSVHERWRAHAWSRLTPSQRRGRSSSFQPDLDPLGSGADFVPFQTHLGLPALSLEFGGESYGSYGAYHSNYDTRWFMDTHGDPGWRYGAALVELLGRTVTRLAAADVLPYRYSHLAGKLREYLQRAEETNVDAQGEPRIAQLGFDGIRLRLAGFEGAAQEVEAALAAALAPGVSPEKLQRVNAHLAKVEKRFVVEDAPRTETGREPRWYRHTLYGWNIYALYAGQTLPALNRAIETGDPAALAAEKGRLERALVVATDELLAVLVALR